jgi:hypothetical protein
MRKFAELLDLHELVTVFELRAKEYGTTIDAICQRIGVSPEQWAAAKEALANPALAPFLKVARGVAVDVSALEHHGGMSWQDPTGAPQVVRRAGAGLYDGHLNALRNGRAARHSRSRKAGIRRPPSTSSPTCGRLKVSTGA